MALRHASMLETNEFLVLDLVRDRGETTRPEIARELGLSPSSVSRIVRRLLDEEVVCEAPGLATLGRPRTVISFNARAGCVVGIDLGGTKCHGVLADLAGTVLVDDLRPTRQQGAPFPTLLATIATLSDRAAQLGLPVAALAVGVPAIVDPQTGVAFAGPNVQWNHFPIVAELDAAVSSPFSVENDVNLAALAHAWRGEAVGRSDFVTFAIGTGIGAAIVSDGRLLRGRNGGAGEVGYFVLERSQIRQRLAEGLGGLERLAAGPAIAGQGRARIVPRPGDGKSAGDGQSGDGQSGDGKSGEMQAAHARPAGSKRNGREWTAESVFELALSGDTAAREIVDELVDHVAMAIVALAAATDPEVVILEGSVGRALEPYLADVRRLAAGQLPYPPEILVSTLGANATALGAVAAALELTRHQRAPASFLDTSRVTRRHAEAGVRGNVAR